MAIPTLYSSFAKMISLNLLILCFWVSPSSSSSSSSCPIDFSSYASNYFPESCKGVTVPSANCCTSSFNHFGLGIAIYLRESGYFELPDNSTVYACLEDYRVSFKFGFSMLACTDFKDPSMLIRSPDFCSGIETAGDWAERVGPTAMNTSCKGDLSSSAACQLCNQDANSAYIIASNLSPNNSGCFYFSVLYASAIINEFGPTNAATAACLLASQYVSSSSNKTHRLIIYGSIGAAIVVLLAALTLILLMLYWVRRRRLYHQNFVHKNKKLLHGSLHPNVGAVWYKFDDIKAATDNFSKTNLVGSGGFSLVYKGVMPDGTLVAVKRIKNCTPEGDADFKNEVEVINSVRHKNLLALRGCCVGSNTELGHVRLLVYDFMPNGSLEEYLLGGGRPLLEWSARRTIALDTARGLTYLHTGIQPAIIHRDIKANNILLDEHLNAHVSDFGLAKVTAEGTTHMTTRVAGTQGYLAPEYALYGQLTEKSDVYSFGVLLLVLMSGRKALDPMGAYPLITDWAWVMVKQGNILGIVDEQIRNDAPHDVMERFILVGILCAHLLVAFRPTMSQALKMLQGDAEIPVIPDRPLPLTHATLFTSVEENSSFSSLPTSAGQCSYDTDDLLR